MVSFNEVRYVERILDATGVTQRELTVYILLLMFAMIGYIAVVMFRFKNDCKHISCSDVKKIRDASDEALSLVQRVSSDVSEGRVESRESFKNLSNTIDKLEDSIIDLRTKSYELSGVMFSSGHTQVDRNRIRHHED